MTILTHPSVAEVNKVLADAVYDAVDAELREGRPGHCLRVSALAPGVMKDLCARFNAAGVGADVVLLLGLGQRPSAPWEVTATRLIELRNAEARPLLAFVPPGLRAAAEDSFDVSTFREIPLASVPAQMRSQLRQRLPDELRSLTDQAIQFLERSERLIGTDEIIRYYLTILSNDSTPAAAGGALYQLGLVPDFALLDIPDRIRQRLDRNVTAVRALVGSSQPLLGRIYELKLQKDSIQSDLHAFLRDRTLDSVADWGVVIATDPAYSHLSFDHWPFKDETPLESRPRLFVDDLNLPPRSADEPVGPDNPLYLDVKRTRSVRIKWETTPKPSVVSDLAYFRIEIVNSEGAVVWESKNIKNSASSRATRSKSIKTADFREQVEDGLHYFRVRAYSESGEILNEEDAESHPDILRDPQNPQGKRINESEDAWFWIDVNDEPSPAEPQRNVVVSSFLEAQLLARFAALDRGDDPLSPTLVPRPEKTGWATARGKRLEAIYHIVYDAQVRFTLSVSNLLRQMESDTLAHPETLGRWRLNFDGGQSARSVQPALRQFADGAQISEAFLQTRAELFQAIRGTGDGLTSTCDLIEFEDLILAYVQTYQKWLAQVQDDFDTWAIRQVGGRRRTDPIFLDLDVVEVLLPSGGPLPDRAYLAAPTHPLRLLWHLQRAKMARAWIQRAVDCGQAAELLTKDVRDYLRQGLAPVNLPPIIRLAHEGYPEAVSHFYVEQGPLTLFWSLCVREDTPDSRALRARVQEALGLRHVEAETALGIPHTTLTQKLRRYLVQHPYTGGLKMNVFNPGDAQLVVDAILELERQRNKDGAPSLRYELRLFTRSAKLDDIGAALEELLNPERQVSAEADAFSVPSKNHLFPKLRFSRNHVGDFLSNPESFHAHISILNDLFLVSVDLETMGPGRSSFVYGLIQEQVTRFAGDEARYAWQRQLLPTHSRELPTDTAALSGELARLLAKIANLQASVAAGKKVDGVLPTVHLNLGITDRNLLYQVHVVSDWVFIVDRNLGLEYFDGEVSDGRPAYLLDFTPEFSRTDCDRLLLTTRALEEVTGLIRPALQQYGLSAGEGAEVYFLHLLRSLSGRLALKLLSCPNAVREALGLAMARLFLEQYGLLSDRIVLPLDAHAALFAQAGQESSLMEELTLQRGDLLLVRCQPETRTLQMHIVEVKWRADLGDLSAYMALRQGIEGQLLHSEEALRLHFDPHLRPIDRVDREVKTKELISLLMFYMERSFRYGLIDDAAKAVLRRFILSLDEGYQVRFAGAGLIFDLAYEGIQQDEEHAGLVFHHVGGDYIRRLLENGLRRRSELTAEAQEKPATIEEIERHKEETERIVRDTSMHEDPSYERVRTHFGLSAAQPKAKERTEVPPTTSANDRGGTGKGAPAAEQPGPQPEEFKTTADPVAEQPEEVKTASEPFRQLAYDVLLGDSDESRQYGILGRVTDRTVALDLNGTSTISLFGVQGGGKSYTVGSVVEMATQALPGINHLPSPLATVIFHYHESQDYPPEFVSMVGPNTVEDEVRILEREYGARPASLEDVLILTPAGKLAARQAEFPDVEVRPIFFSSNELSIKDWRFLMGVFGTQMYMKQINLIMRDLREELTLETLAERIASSELSDGQKTIARVRLRFAEQFIDDGARLAEVLRPGRMIVVDLRDEFIDKDEALGLFVVMLNIFANAGHGQDFNKLIVFDEAHKYMDDPELTSHIVDVIRQMRHQGVSVLIASQDPPSLPYAIIELSSLVILHRFNSPQWLKHVQRAITALADLSPAQMAALRPGEAYVWATKASEAIFTQKAIKMRFRPRVTQHGGGTKKAVAD